MRGWVAIAAGLLVGCSGGTARQTRAEVCAAYTATRDAVVVAPYEPCSRDARDACASAATPVCAWSQWLPGGRGSVPPMNICTQLCDEDSDCPPGTNGQPGMCIPGDDSPVFDICLQRCTVDGDCPSGSECQDIVIEGIPPRGRACVPYACE